MPQSTRHPSVEILRTYTLLEDLSKDQLHLLAHSLIIKEAKGGKRVLQRGSEEKYSFYLLKGRVELEAEDGRTAVIEAETDSACRPISQLLPRQYNVVAMGPIEYFEVDTMLLQDVKQNTGIMVHDEDEVNPLSDSNDESATAASNQLTAKIREDLEKDTLTLPSLPEVAIRIGRALEEDIADAKKIGRMIQSDPAITAKIIKAANSAVFHGRDPVETCTNAVVRLGLNTTHKLVVSFALGELFRARTPALQERMKQLWEHSTQVGSICFVLAHLTKQFNRDHAMLAGLTHDIGTVAILTYADKFPEIANNPAHLNQTIEALRAETGSLILRKWNFSEEYVEVAKEAFNWMRDPDPKPDYADLVIIAKMHSYVGTPMIKEVPSIGDLPCFSKLNLGEITPQLSLKILEKAESQLERAQSLLRV